jgi:hypothetical protein
LLEGTVATAASVPVDYDVGSSDEARPHLGEPDGTGFTARAADAFQWDLADVGVVFLRVADLGSAVAA